ncbi:MAG: hypothetical protein ACLRM8_00275 [Alistipes sp.]
MWKDHGAAGVGEITALCARGEINYARRSGNHYSSECFWSKVLHLLRGSNGCAAMRGPSSSCATGFRPC